MRVAWTALLLIISRTAMKPAGLSPPSSSGFGFRPCSRAHLPCRACCNFWSSIACAGAGARPRPMRSRPRRWDAAPISTPRSTAIRASWWDVCGRCSTAIMPKRLGFIACGFPRAAMKSWSSIDRRRRRAPRRKPGVTSRRTRPPRPVATVKRRPGPCRHCGTDRSAVRRGHRARRVGSPPPSSCCSPQPPVYGRRPIGEGLAAAW